MLTRIMRGYGIFHQQVLHADAAAADFLAGADETAHLSSAVNCDLDQAHPGIEPPVLALLALDGVHGLDDLVVALGVLSPVAEERQDFADQLSRREPAAI